MSTETPAAAGRPRPWLLIALAVAVAALLATRMWTGGSAAVPSPSSNQSGAQKPGDPARVDPQELKVRLEALEAPKPDAADAERNPFRFQPRAAPPPPAEVNRPPASSTTAPPGPAEPALPTIPLKFMGSVDLPGGAKLAALSDCKTATFSAKEGDVVDGRYRVVKIGLESITIEYVDGRGRQTLRKEGCPAYK